MSDKQNKTTPAATEVENQNDLLKKEILWQSKKIIKLEQKITEMLVSFDHLKYLMIKSLNEQLQNVDNQDCIKLIIKDTRLKDIDEYITELTSDFIETFGFEPSKLYLTAEGDSLSIRMYLN
ncbi:hypothetical protein Q0N41_04895 [Bacillus altitudinis]|uniref:hypothetical protein n=1 Tax=Bacillus altitudinis TaxID=293387 RepID=UPI001C2192B8|nr:hypothetical protein [Bacillus altitudinis]MBU8968009.1 hypothetical protein [Bacillus altitudinis]UTX10528.1 hypothetical protein NMH04_08785 [Bacillus altitudinis]